eukprot:939727-Rhodomonas_salina.5
MGCHVGWGDPTAVLERAAVGCCLSTVVLLTARGTATWGASESVKSTAMPASVVCAIRVSSLSRRLALG